MGEYLLTIGRDIQAIIISQYWEGIFQNYLGMNFLTYIVSQVKLTTNTI